MQIMFAFILGLALFLTNLFNEWDHLMMLLLVASLTMGTFSIFAGSMFCKDTSELDQKLKISSIAGAAFFVVAMPAFLAIFYGSDYKMGWVAVSALISLLVSFYTYYDVVIFHDKALFEENEYILSALYVYIDFLWLVYAHVIKPCVEKGYEMASNRYQQQRDTV